MSFFYFPPGGGGGTPAPSEPPTGGEIVAKVKIGIDLSSQIDGVKDTFIVPEANYVAGSLDCSIGGLDMQKNNHFFEEDPAIGAVRVARVLTADDIPLKVTYVIA